MRSKQCIKSIRGLNNSKLEGSINHLFITDSLQRILNEHINYMYNNNISKLTFTYTQSHIISILFDGGIEFTITELKKERENI